MKYLVGLFYEAARWFEVEAASPKEAVDQIINPDSVSVFQAVLCEECSKDLEISPYTGYSVIDVVSGKKVK